MHYTSTRLQSTSNRCHKAIVTTAHLLVEDESEALHLLLVERFVQHLALSKRQLGKDGLVGGVLLHCSTDLG